jgi:hypothetical protein
MPAMYRASSRARGGLWRVSYLPSAPVLRSSKRRSMGKAIAKVRSRSIWTVAGKPPLRVLGFDLVP